LLLHRSLGVEHEEVLVADEFAWVRRDELLVKGFDGLVDDRGSLSEDFDEGFLGDALTEVR
jgi:hypothetical protein